MTPEQIVEEELVPREPAARRSSARSSSRSGFVQGPLSAEALGLWETAWSEVKST